MKLSANFTREEFDCKDGTPVPDVLMDNLIRLVEGVLQPLRDVVGRLVVDSGYRTPEHNKEEGGAEHSNHLTARAADIVPLDCSVEELHEAILRMKREGHLQRLGGVGYYPGRWVHVDTYQAADGHLRRWVGAGRGSEDPR